MLADKRTRTVTTTLIKCFDNKSVQLKLSKLSVFFHYSHRFGDHFCTFGNGTFGTQAGRSKRTRFVCTKLTRLPHPNQATVQGYYTEAISLVFEKKNLSKACMSGMVEKQLGRGTQYRFSTSDNQIISHRHNSQEIFDSEASAKRETPVVKVEGYFELAHVEWSERKLTVFNDEFKATN